MSKLLSITIMFLAVSFTQQALQSQEPEALKLNGPALSGLLVSFFAFFLLLCGLIPLMSIQTPVQFARLPLIIGKES